MFPVWNEPNSGYNPLYGGFWTGTQIEYFWLYNYTALAMKAASESFIVGGPAVSVCFIVYAFVYLLCAVCCRLQREAG